MTLIAFNIFPALLAFAGAKDLFFMRIPNWISIGLVCWFFVLAVIYGVEMTVLVNHLGAALLVLLVAFFLFCFGWIGGGDAKLMSAISLWIGFNPLLLEYWLLSSVLGGALTFAILLFRRASWFVPPWGWLERLHNKKNGVPYGIALAGAGLVLYSRTFMFDILAN